MAGLDLRGLQRVVEEWLVDDLAVTRDNGSADDVLDEATGKLTSPAPTNVWSGSGAVQPLTVDHLTDPDVAQVVNATGATHRALLPVDGLPAFRYGDLLRVVATHGSTPDPLLVGARFEIVHPGTPSTWTVVRVLYLTIQTGRPAA